MASLAEDTGSNGKAGKAPISTHPAFPFIVALWFAALLGMGSLVVPVALIEQIAVSTGLASIVPATAPPLGFTARALIALAFTGAGAMAGLLIARQIAKTHAPEAARRYPAARGPIFANAELGAQGLDGHAPAVQPKGRRALAIDVDTGPSQLLDLAPLPGMRIDHGTSPLELLDHDARETLPEAWNSTPFADDDAQMDELAELELTEDDQVAESLFGRAPARAAEIDPNLTFSPAPIFAPATPGFQTFADDSGDETMNDMSPFSLPRETVYPEAHAAPRPAVRQQFRAPPETVIAPNWSADDEIVPAVDEAVAEDAADWAEEADFAPEPAEKPLAFSAPSLARFDPPAELENTALEDTALDDTGDEAQAAPEPSQLDDLGLVQLAQRLGNSIERRRELLAARAQLAAVAAALPPLGEDLEAAAPDEAAQAMAAYFARPAEMPVEPEAGFAPEEPVAEELGAEELGADEPAQTPVAERQLFQPVAEDSVAAPHPLYRPLGGFAQIDIEDEDEDEEIADLAASFSLPLARQQAEPVVAAMPEIEIDEDDEIEPDFASLLTLRNPFHDRTEVFVRIEDEPEAVDSIGQTAVIFPAEAPARAFAAPQSIAPAASAELDSEENERALREALLSLQRMSGAA